MFIIPLNLKAIALPACWGEGFLSTFLIVPSALQRFGAVGFVKSLLASHHTAHAPYVRILATEQVSAIVAITTNLFKQEPGGVQATGCADFLYKPFREAGILAVMNKQIGLRYFFDVLARVGD